MHLDFPGSFRRFSTTTSELLVMIYGVLLGGTREVPGVQQLLGDHSLECPE